MRKSRTTGQAAQAAKISRASLQEWIRVGKIAAPAVQLVKGKAVRLWTTRDIEKLRDVKSVIYGQGKGKRKEKRRER
jgi:predicted site-specific integrase-resolvase